MPAGIELCFFFFFYASEEGQGLKNFQFLKSMAEFLSKHYTISGAVTATKHSYINLHVYNPACSISIKLFVFLSFQPDKLMSTNFL